MEFLPMEFWYWWLLGALLLLIELLSATFVCLWLAAAAGVTGLFAWLLPELAWQWQTLIFAVCGALSLGYWQRHYRHNDGTDNGLNRRAAQYLGRVFDLAEPIVNGQGRIRVDDSLWKVAGPDCGVPGKVKVIGVRGAILDVALTD
jgi:inner membrane protein